MNTFSKIISELNLGSRLESDVHPHCPDERASLFHSGDGGSTEVEFLSLINSIVLATKPSSSLETGTFNGFGTIAIAAALEDNKFGTVTTLDINQCEFARGLPARFNIEGRCRFEKRDSMEFCANYDGEPFGFVFFDSEHSLRHHEYRILKARGKIARGAICCVHDTSKYRYGVPMSHEMLEFFSRVPNRIAIDLSRGITMFQEP